MSYSLQCEVRVVSDMAGDNSHSDRSKYLKQVPHQRGFGTVPQFVTGFFVYLSFFFILFVCTSHGWFTSLSHFGEAAFLSLVVLFGTGVFLHLKAGWRGYLPGLCTAFCLSCLIGGFGGVFVAGHAVATFFSNCKGFN